jgi:hypothetical protein
VYAEDMDGDGDADVIGAGLFESTIAWWENVDGSGNSWIQHVSCADCDGAFAVYTGDFDGDGHMDILGAANTSSRIEWYSAASEGVLESSILDTQCAPGWDYLDWSAAAPAGSSVSFQVRASDDFAAMGSWSDVITQPSPLAGILSDGDRYFQYRVILSSIDSGSIPSLDEVAVSWDPMGIEGGENPVVPVLLPVAPNPSSSPIVRFGIPEPGPAGISVFDLTGRLVLDEVTDYQAGFHEMALDGLSAGIYFCRMTSGDFSASERFVVIE